MAALAGYLTVALAGSTANLIGSGLQVPLIIDADMIAGAGVLFDVKGDDFDWYFDSGTDVVQLVSTDGFQVLLTRKGDYFQWLPDPEDLGAAAAAIGSTVTKSCQLVVERSTAGVRTRLTSRPFSVILDRRYGFTPQSISGLIGWYDAYDLSAISAGAAVPSWPDKTLLNRDLAEATNQPDKAVTEAGRPYVNFNGTNDLLASTLADAGLASTVFVVASIDSYDATVRGIVQVGGTNGARIAFDNANLKGISGSDVANGTLPSLDAWFAAVATKTASGAITIQKGLGAPVSQASTAAVTPGTVGLGDTAADSAADVRIAEVVIYDSVLSAGNIERVMRYLMAKWGAQG